MRQSQAVEFLEMAKTFDDLEIRAYALAIKYPKFADLAFRVFEEISKLKNDPEKLVEGLRLFFLVKKETKDKRFLTMCVKCDKEINMLNAKHYCEVVCGVESCEDCLDPVPKHMTAPTCDMQGCLCEDCATVYYGR